MATTDGQLVSRRGLLRGSLALAALASLSGCTGTASGGGSSTPPAAGSAASEPATLSLGILEPVCIDPFNAVDEAGAQVAYQLFDPLTRYDFEAGELVYLAAESCAASEDRRTFTFVLREATFHDGTPVRSADFKRAWERIASPISAATQYHGASSAAYLLSLVEGYQALRDGSATGLSGVACPDDRTLAVTLSIPYADFPYVVANPCLAPVPAAAEEDAAAFAVHPVGNGPFSLAEAYSKGDTELELVAYEGYTGDAPRIAGARLFVYQTMSDSYQALEEGDLMASPCPVERVDTGAAAWRSDDPALELTRDRRCVLGCTPTVSMLVCNTAAAPLDNAGLRYAVSMAIDREDLARTVFRDARMAADGVVAPDVPGYRTGAWPYAVYDADAATQLLDTLYPRDSSGERDVHLTLSYSSGSGQDDAMEAIASDLEAVGITCDLDPVPYDALRNRLATGNFQLGRFDWTPGFMSMDNVLYPLFDSASIGSRNYARYSDEQVDALIFEARGQVGEEVRIELLQQAEDIVAADCPVIPYLFGGFSFSGTQELESLPVDPLGYAHLAEAELAE